jgi:hypothetical protein
MHPQSARPVECRQARYCERHHFSATVDSMQSSVHMRTPTGPHHDLPAARPPRCACRVGPARYHLSGTRITDDGWRRESWGWPGDDASVTRTLVMLPRAGTRPQLIVQGDVPYGIARLFTEVEVPDPAACPCGCGAGGSDGAACDTRRGGGFLSGVYAPRDRTPSSRTPATPQPPAKKSQATIAPESRRLGIDRRTTPLIPGSGSFPPSINANRLEFVGDGRSVRAP